MASLRDIKKKIKSAKNIGQVTKALEMVSAVKMRRAQYEASLSRPYATEIAEALNSFDQNFDQSHPLLSPPINPDAPLLLVIIAPDKGLAGPLITNLLKQIHKFKSNHSTQIQTIVWGKKAANIALKLSLPIIADVTPSKTTIASVQKAILARLIIDAYKQGTAQAVWLAYSKFVNTLVQEPTVTLCLPVAKTRNDSHQQNSFEPSISEVQDFLIQQYIEVQLSQIVKESVAAEHSARMVAMKKARDNALDIVSDYQLLYNKTRQEKITNEIADLTANLISL